MCLWQTKIVKGTIFTIQNGDREESLLFITCDIIIISAVGCFEFIIAEAAAGLK